MSRPTDQPTLDRRRFLLACAAVALPSCTAARPKPPEAKSMPISSVVIRRGRVIDPGQGVDALMDVAIDNGAIAAVGPDLQGHLVLDATGCVVAPGFIDLHSHAQ